MRKEDKYRDDGWERKINLGWQMWKEDKSGNDGWERKKNLGMTDEKGRLI